MKELKYLPVCVRLNKNDVTHFQLTYPMQLSDFIRFCIREVLENPERWQVFKAYQEKRMKNGI